jgi:hypothetical protein
LFVPSFPTFPPLNIALIYSEPPYPDFPSVTPTNTASRDTSPRSLACLVLPPFFEAANGQINIVRILLLLGAHAHEQTNTGSHSCGRTGRWLADILLANKDKGLREMEGDLWRMNFGTDRKTSCAALDSLESSVERRLRV